MRLESSFDLILVKSYVQWATYRSGANMCKYANICEDCAVYQIKALSLKLKSRFTFNLVKTYSVIVRQTYYVFIMCYGGTSVKPCIVIDVD